MIADIDDLIPVIDLASYQYPVNFQKMVDNGVEGIILKLGNGKLFDGTAPEMMEKARKLGLKIGCYWFMNPKADFDPRVQMDRFAGRVHQLETVLGKFDIPWMMDVESFVNEYPSRGSSAGWTGPTLQRWLEAAANHITEVDGVDPIIYSNGAYFNGNKMVAGTMARCSLIVARYVFYSPGQPRPPMDSQQWDSWVHGITSKRPQIPSGWLGWSGWQFLAGYDGMGFDYGASSNDIDLNVIKRSAWTRWLEQKAGPHLPPPIEIEPPVPVTPPPVVVIPTPPPIPVPPIPNPVTGAPHMDVKLVSTKDGSRAALQLIYENGYTFHGIDGGDFQAVRDIWKPSGEGAVSTALYDDLAAKALR